MVGARSSAGRFAFLPLVLVVALLLLVSPPARASEDVWHGTDADEVVIHLYFVYSSTCPHCLRAIPFVEDVENSRPWLQVTWLQADSGDPEVADIALGVAAEIGEDITGVPTFMFCGEMLTGYDSPEGVGATIVERIDTCHDEYTSAPGPVPTTTIAPAEVEVPVVGSVSASSVPLPVFTAIVAGLDAFNPCAFFVLLFLLSLLVHTRRRSRMAIVGATFVVISGVLYFIFMAAWLNIFLVTGHLKWITVAAGVVALVVAVLNLKDYVRPGAPGSLSIPETAKPGLYQRMRGLVVGERFLPVLGATVALAVVANSYELLCTAGLPMVFTRVLTLNDLSVPTYYGYLVFYNLIYVIPLLVIVTVFVWKLGSRKLQPNEGRTLKLLSGLMMFGLGSVLLLAPELLEQMGVAIGILVGSIVITALVTLVNRSHGESASLSQR